MERHLFLPLIIKNSPHLSIKLCNFIVYCCRLVTKSCPILCDPIGLQHARPPCPSAFLETCWNSCPLSQWSHPTLWSSVTQFSSCLQSFPASEYFPMSQLCSSSGQNIRASGSACPSIEYSELGSFRIDCFELLAEDPSASEKSSPTPQVKSINSSMFSFLYGPTLTSIHDHWENHSFD